MKALDIVRHRISGKTGVILDTIPMLQEDGPLSVVFDKSTTAEVITNERAFDVIGTYRATADEAGCGVGKDNQACRFLGVGRDGYVCNRFTSLHWPSEIRFSHRRGPNRLYPHCKIKTEQGV